MRNVSSTKLHFENASFETHISHMLQYMRNDFSYVAIYEKYEFQHTFVFVLWVVSRKTQILLYFENEWFFDLNCRHRAQKYRLKLVFPDLQFVSWKLHLFRKIIKVWSPNAIFEDWMHYFLLFGLINNKYFYCILTNASLVGYGNSAYIH